MQNNLHLYLCVFERLKLFQTLAFILFFIDIPVVFADSSSQNEILEEPTYLNPLEVVEKSVSGIVRDLPVSRTFFTSENLRENNISDVPDLSTEIPGLFSKQMLSGNNQLTLRGIGLTSIRPNSSSPVATYVDGRYLSYGPMLAFPFFDIEDVLIEKGPQGTRYGRNSEGGALHVKSKPVSLIPETFASLGISSFQTIDSELTVGGPLSENIAGRLALFSQQRSGGYIDNRFTGETVGDRNTLAARGRLKWQADKQFSATLEFRGGRIRQDTLPYEHIGTVDPLTGTEPCAPVAQGFRSEGACTDFLGYFDPDDDPYSSDLSYSLGDQKTVDIWGTSLFLDYQLNGINISSITTYERVIQEVGDDIDASPFIQQDIRHIDNIYTLSQEFHIEGQRGKFDWLLGTHYAHDQIKGSQRIDSPDLFLTNALTQNKQDTDVIALFGHTNWNFNKSWSLSSGLRINYENIKYIGGSVDLNPTATSIIQGGPGIAPIGPIVTSFTNDRIDDTDVTGTLGIQYSPSYKWSWYANTSKGHKTGSFPGTFTASNDQLRPSESDDLYALETGLSTYLLGGDLHIEASVYRYWWKNFQAFTKQFRGGIAVYDISNIGDADILGVETNLKWQPNNSWDFDAGISWTDSEISSNKLLAGGLNANGNQLPNTPELTLRLGAGYERHIGQSGWEMGISSRALYQDNVFFELANQPIFTENSYWLLNASAVLISPKENVKIRLYGKNLTDKVYKTQSFDLIGFGNAFSLYGEPRTIGISIEWLGLW